MAPIYLISCNGEECGYRSNIYMPVDCIPELGSEVCPTCKGEKLSIDLDKNRRTASDCTNVKIDVLPQGSVDRLIKIIRLGKLTE